MTFRKAGLRGLLSGSPTGLCVMLMLLLFLFNMLEREDYYEDT